MAANSTDISVCARLSELPRLTRLLVEDAQRLGISADVCLRLQLIAEELFTNTVTHGFRQDSDASVSLCLASTPLGIKLHYADSAPPYDPTLSPEQAASQDMEGGLGVTLIRGMSRDFHYERQQGRNICEILL